MPPQTKPPLCRYCRRFLDKAGKNGICSICWRIHGHQEPNTLPYNDLKVDRYVNSVVK